MIWIVLIVLLLSSVLPLIKIFRPKASSWFFGGNKSLADVIKYSGTIGAAVIVIVTLYQNNQTNMAAFESNSIMKKAQLDNRFIEANNLLASSDISANVAGIYALHQIAIDASKENVQKGYVPVIKNILCALIRANSIIEKDTVYTLKEKVFFQTAINVLLRDDFKYSVDIERDTSTYSFDLQGSILSGCDLSNTHSGGGAINLRGAYLENSILNRAHLENANLNEANLTGALLNEAILENANLNEANLTGALLNEAILENANLNEANLTGAYFNGAILIGAHLNKAIISNAQFENADLRNSEMKNASNNNTWPRINFIGANLNNSNLERSSFFLANFEGASIEGANLKYAYLFSAVFQNTLLNNTILDSTYLVFANFDDAKLIGVSFEGAALSRTFLKNTIFNKVNFKNALFFCTWSINNQSVERYTDFSESIFDETTNFEGTIFEGKTPEEIKLWCKNNLFTDRYDGALHGKYIGESD